jgi:hypothetical protein
MRGNRRRRIGLILALAAALAPAGPARAHSCTVSTDAAVGEQFAVSLGIPAEESAVVGVDVTLPNGFRLEEADPEEGWATQQEGGRLHFSGGTVPSYSCAYFTLWGEVTRPGKLAFTLTTHHEDGATTAYDGDKIGGHFAAQFVFAGVEPQPSDYVDESGRNPVLVAAVALGCLAVVGAVLLARRRPAGSRR